MIENFHQKLLELRLLLSLKPIFHLGDLFAVKHRNSSCVSRRIFFAHHTLLNSCFGSRPQIRLVENRLIHN